MIKIDKEKCVGCMLCESMIPEIFEVKDCLAVVKSQVDDPQIGDVIDSCPMNAISK